MAAKDALEKNWMEVSISKKECEHRILLGINCYKELLNQIMEEKQVFPICTRDLTVTVNIRMNITTDYMVSKPEL